MNIEKNLMVNEIYCTATKIFEIRKSWADGLRTGLVLMLYPTIDRENIGRKNDSTLNGLMNHVDEVGWSSVRICNLFSTVFEQKPLYSELSVDDENIRYIKSIIDKEDLSNTDVVIATGCSLKTNLPALKTKLTILEAFKKKGIKVGQFVTEYSRDLAPGPHVLYMHLHYGDLKWEIDDYPMDEEIKNIKEYISSREGQSKITELGLITTGKKANDVNKK